MLVELSMVEQRYEAVAHLARARFTSPGYGRDARLASWMSC